MLQVVPWEVLFPFLSFPSLPFFHVLRYFFLSSFCLFRFLEGVFVVHVLRVALIFLSHFLCPYEMLW